MVPALMEPTVLTWERCSAYPRCWLKKTAAESATFPKISKSSARNQRKKVVENCELQGLENLYSSTAHFGPGGYGWMEALDLEARLLFWQLLVIGLQGFRRFQKPRTLQCNTTDYQMALWLGREEKNNRLPTKLGKPGWRALCSPVQASVSLSSWGCFRLSESLGVESDRQEFESSTSWKLVGSFLNPSELSFPFHRIGMIILTFQRFCEDQR